MTCHKYYIVTATAPVNIAVIKYWGKRDEQLILPLNDSISFTLGQSEMCATTTASISPAYTHDAFWLNGKEEPIENPRIQNCLKEIRNRGKKRSAGGTTFVEDRTSWRVHICSTNNFPTAAGLASSAAGYAAMVVAVAKVYDVAISDAEMSVAARQGSGSACRSVLGGLVRWHKGTLRDGTDSLAEQIVPQDYWGENIHAIICVASGRRKKTGSTEGMRRCVNNSAVLGMRVKETVNERIQAMLNAVKNKDWSAFCDITMTDSNEMHASCLAALPPLIYMNDTSHAVATLVHEYNRTMVEDGRPELKMCYTFDAGPNACLFVPEAAVGQALALILKAFPPSEHTQNDTSYVKGMTWTLPTLTTQLETVANDHASAYCHSSTQSIKLNYIIHTTVGEGPRVLARSSHESMNENGNNNGFPQIAGTMVTNGNPKAKDGVSKGKDSSERNSPPPPKSIHLIDPITGNPIYSPPIS